MVKKIFRVFSMLLVSMLFLSFGNSSLFRLEFVIIPGIKTPVEKGDLKFFLQQVNFRTNASTIPESKFVNIKSKDFFTQPFFILYGCNSFPPFSPEIVKRLRLYLQMGGIIFIDSCDTERLTDFNSEIKKQFLQILPGKKWQKLPPTHVIYQTFYLLDSPEGRVEKYPYLEGINSWGRTVVIFSGNDLIGCLQQDAFGNFLKELSPGWSMQREFCVRTMINLIFYALTGTYKKDQLHTPYILERRQKRGFYKKWIHEMMKDVEKRKKKFEQIQKNRRKGR